MSTLDTDASNTCTNDLEYPNEWLDSDYFLHDTIEGCCDMFGGTCETRDWCAEQNQAKINGAKLQNEGTFQKYDGIIMWNFGSPPEWEVDSDTNWMINIPSSDTSATRSLITEINLPNRGSIECNIGVWAKAGKIPSCVKRVTCKTKLKLACFFGRGQFRHAFANRKNLHFNQPPLTPEILT